VIKFRLIRPSERKDFKGALNKAKLEHLKRIAWKKDYPHILALYQDETVKKVYKDSKRLQELSAQLSSTKFDRNC